MDTQAINSMGNPKVPPTKTQSSSSSSGSKAVPTPKPKASGDSVELSSEAQSLLKGKKGGQASSNSEQRKFSVTENNDVVLQVINPKTQKVIKSIPTQEQIDLRNAVRDGINDFMK
jgi:uncharacterized FlaG/YvyC family protein